MAVGVLPVALYFALPVLLFAMEERDPRRRGMAEIHVLNESGQAIEILALEAGEDPLRWAQRWDEANKRWIESSPTSSPMLLAGRAQARTSLLDPGSHPLRLVLRLEPGQVPMTFGSAFSVQDDTFCEIVVRLERHSIQMSDCSPRATMIRGYPDL